jgi:hypothetical protein
MEGSYNICKSINVTQHMNKIKDKNHMTISIDAVKAFGKIQHLFMIKALNKLEIERMHLNTIKSIYDESIANIALSGEKLNLCLLTVACQEQDKVVHFLYSFSRELKFLARAICKKTK